MIKAAAFRLLNYPRTLLLSSRQYDFSLKTKEFLHLEGFKIKSFEFAYPPPNCEIEIDEFQPLTQGLRCNFKNFSYGYASEITIIYQRYATVLQDIHNYPPQEMETTYRWNPQSLTWDQIKNHSNVEVSINDP